jgi:hypothetical protein
MPKEEKVILDLSPEVQTLLEEQGVDLYEEIQRELPSTRLEMQSDPEASQGSKDVVTIIAVTATLVSSLTPIILRVLNMITPPDRAQTWTVEEIETRHPDGSTTIHRKRILSSSEQRPYQQQAEQPNTKEIARPNESKESKE